MMISMLVKHTSQKKIKKQTYFTASNFFISFTKVIKALPKNAHSLKSV